MEIQIKTNASGELYLEDAGGRVTRLYRFREALALARISAATYYTWVKHGLIRDARLRNRGQWRVFTEGEVRALVQLSRKLSDPSTGWQIPAPDDRSYQPGNESRKWREAP